MRRMTADERRGFDMACDTLALWGAQIERCGVSLAQDDEPIPRGRVQAHCGRMIQDLAAALQGATPPAG